MKHKGHSIIALILTAALLTGQSGWTVYADELPAETVVDAAETTPPIQNQEDPVQTEPAAPAVEQQPETQAPETTAAPEEDTPLPAPAADNPSDITSGTPACTEKTTETPVSESDSALSTEQTTEGGEVSSEASSGPVSEKAAETETEKVTEDDGIDDGYGEDDGEDEEEESESEELTDTFTGTVDGARVQIVLGPEDELPADSVFVLHKIVKSEEPDRWKRIRNTMHAYTDQSGRELTIAAYYEYYFLVKNEKVSPAGAVTLTFTYPEHKSLKLDINLQPEAGVFAVSDSVLPLIAPDLDNDLNVTGFTVTVKDLKVLALGGIQSVKPEADETASENSKAKGDEKPGPVMSGNITVPYEITAGDAGKAYAADAGKELSIKSGETALTFDQPPVMADDGTFSVDFSKASNIADFFTEEVTEVQFTVTIPVPAEPAGYRAVGAEKTVTVKKDGDSYIVTPASATLALIPETFNKSVKLEIHSVDKDTGKDIDPAYASVRYDLYDNASDADKSTVAVISDGVLYFNGDIFGVDVTTRSCIVREVFDSYLYDKASSTDQTITLTKTEEGTGDETKEVITVSPETLTYEHTPRTITFTVKATDRDDASAMALPGAKFTIKAEGGSGTAYTDTIVTYSVKTTALPEETRKKLAGGGTVTFEVKETAPPTGYEALTGADAAKTVTVTPDKDTKGLQTSPSEVIFPHTKTVLTFTVNAVDQDGKDIDDVEYTVSPAAANTDGAKNKQTFTIDLKNSDITNMPNNSDLTLSVTETVPGKYELDPETQNPQTITVHRAENGVFSITGNKDLVFRHKEKPVIVNLTVIIDDLNGAKLDGTVSIKDSNGNILYGYDGDTLRELSDVYVPELGKTIRISSEDNPELKEGSVLTVTQIRVADTYTIVEVDGETADKKLTVKTDEQNVSDLTAQYINHRYEANETLRVTKRLTVGTSFNQSAMKMIYSSQKESMFYVALFADKARTRRVTGIYPVSISKKSPYGTLKLTNLPAGTYWIGETDSAGNLISTSYGYRVGYSSDSAETGKKEAGKISLSATTKKAHSITIYNRYDSLPDGYEYVAQIGIRKLVYTAEGQIDSSFNGKVRVRVYRPSENGKQEYSQTKEIEVKNGKSDYQAIYVPLGTSGKAKTIRVTEVSEKKSSIANTAILANGKTYKVSIDTPKFSLKPSSTLAQKVTVTNTLYEEKKDAEQAVLKLTKKVQYKKAPIRVNAVYYIGIFDDAALTKLRYKRALQFRNASEVTATLKINLYKLASKEVTFYFAETDRNGKPVTGGKAVGYNIEQNKKSITLNEENPEDELIITNSVLEGTKRERILLDPSSGFAGDRAALAEAQERENEGSHSAVTTTGDNSPLVPWSAALVGSMMVLILYPLFAARRRKSRRGK